MMRATRWILTLLLAALAPMAMAMAAAPTIAGERHGVTTLNSAAIRDGARREVLRFTVWYPAIAGSEETPLTIGPPDAPLFEVGRAAKDAPIAGGRLPTLLLSHGNGGTARTPAIERSSCACCTYGCSCGDAAAARRAAIVCAAASCCGLHTPSSGCAWQNASSRVMSGRAPALSSAVKPPAE